MGVRPPHLHKKAGVLKLENSVDSKSTASNGLRVQVPPPAQKRTGSTRAFLCVVARLSIFYFEVRKFVSVFFPVYFNIFHFSENRPFSRPFKYLLHHLFLAFKDRFYSAVL